MYCSNCGKKLPDGVTVCPDCVPASPTPAPSYENKNKYFKQPGKLSKSYAAIVSALMVFPATLCVAIDLVFDRYDYWFGYVVGAIIVAWVIAVLPALRITPPLVTGLICFAAIIGYVSFIVGKTGHLLGLYKIGLPLFVLGAAFIAIDSSLIGGKKLTGIHILSVLSAECAVFLIALEATIDNLVFGQIDLRWSLITACAFVSAIAVLEAFAYVGRINKK